MSALPLFDLMLSAGIGPTVSGPAGLERASRWAGQLVDELSAELRHIEAMDDDLGAVTGAAGFDRQAAALLRGAYEDWARRADALLGRVARIERSGAVVPGAGDLYDSHGRVSAALAITVEDLDEADEEIRRGDVLSRDEVLRELRA